MKLDKKSTQIERWKLLGNCLKSGNRYTFYLNDGGVYEGELIGIGNGEEEVEVHLYNMVDRSPNPRFGKVEMFGFDISEIDEVVPVE